jgi:hypothetical protein
MGKADRELHHGSLDKRCDRVSRSSLESCAKK